MPGEERVLAFRSVGKARAAGPLSSGSEALPSSVDWSLAPGSMEEFALSDASNARSISDRRVMFIPLFQTYRVRYGIEHPISADCRRFNVKEIGRRIEAAFHTPSIMASFGTEVKAAFFVRRFLNVAYVSSSGTLGEVQGRLLGGRAECPRNIPAKKVIDTPSGHLLECDRCEDWGVSAVGPRCRQNKRGLTWLTLRSYVRCGLLSFSFGGHASGWSAPGRPKSV